MNKLHMVRLALVIESIVLLINAVIISRNYQDTWILEGLEIPFAIFALSFLIYALSESDVKWIISFAVIFRLVLSLIPNLKYEWFQGVWIDQHSHYRMAQDIFNTGFIPTDRSYSGTPLMHLGFAILARTTGISVVSSFKYLPTLMWALLPVVTYAVLKSCGLNKRTVVLKYSLIISAIPVAPSTSYIVAGLSIGLFLSLLVLLQFMKLLHDKDRRDLIVLGVYGLALASAHSYSATLLTIALFAVHIASRLAQRFRHWNLRQLQLKSLLVPSILIGVVNLAWLSHGAIYMLDVMVRFMARYIRRALGATVVNLDEPVAPRFFELMRIDFIEGLKVVLVWYGATLLVVFLVVVGLLFAAKKFREQSKSLIFLFLYIIAISLFLISGLALGVASGWSERIITQLVVLCPIFCGIPLSYINRKAPRLTAFIIAILIALATIELYGYQPLVPSASVINNELPADVPIGYRVNVNSIYQKNMIDYAEKHLSQNQDASIACDRVTSFQIVGLTDWNFSTRYLTWYYPLETTMAETEYQYLLIHLPGKSGRFYEQAEARTPSLILKTVQNSSIIYNNGESFILVK